MNPKEVSRLMAVKSALIATTATPGWAYIKQIADNLVARAIDEALTEEESSKGESKRLKAAALKKGFSDLFTVIETTKDMVMDAQQDLSADAQGELIQ